MKTAAIARIRHTEEETAGKSENFVRLLQTIELLHRRFLDVVTAELGQRDKALSSVQALILSHVRANALSLGELQRLGHYEGTNLDYNVGKLAEGGFLTLERPHWDRKSTRVELTSEGRAVAERISGLIDRHAGSLAAAGISEADLSLATRMLGGLNRLWSA